MDYLWKYSRSIAKAIGIVILVLCATLSAWSTHNRAGEIIYDQIGPLTIRAPIVTYTKASSTAADPAIGLLPPSIL